MSNSPNSQTSLVVSQTAYPEAPVKPSLSTAAGMNDHWYGIMSSVVVVVIISMLIILIATSSYMLTFCLHPAMFILGGIGFVISKAMLLMPTYVSSNRAQTIPAWYWLALVGLLALCTLVLVYENTTHCWWASGLLSFIFLADIAYLAVLKYRYGYEIDKTAFWIGIASDVLLFIAAASTFVYQ